MFIFTGQFIISNPFFLDLQKFSKWTIRVQLCNVMLIDIEHYEPSFFRACEDDLHNTLLQYFRIFRVLLYSEWPGKNTFKYLHSQMLKYFKVNPPKPDAIGLVSHNCSPGKIQFERGWKILCTQTHSNLYKYLPFFLTHTCAHTRSQTNMASHTGTAVCCFKCRIQKDNNHSLHTTKHWGELNTISKLINILDRKYLHNVSNLVW